MRACHRSAAADAQRVASGRTVSKATLSSEACMDKADRARRHRKERRVDGVLGIDIAKAKFEVALLRPDGTVRHKSCANTISGFEQLAEWLRRQGVTRLHACLGGDGHLWRRARDLAARRGLRGQRRESGNHA